MASVSNLEKLRGGRPAPLTTRRFFSGLFTNRSPLVQPGDGANTRYYEAIAGGKSDALIGGLNMEVSNRNTIVTRAGFSEFFTPSGWGTTTLGFYSAVMPGNTQELYDFADSVWVSGTKILSKANPIGFHCNFITIGTYTFLAGAHDNYQFVWDGNTSHAVDQLGINTPSVTPSLVLNAGSGMKASTGWQYVYCYHSSKYGHVSSASVNSASTGPGNWASITVSGYGSSQSEVDTIQIYRTLDGGANYLYVGSLANPGNTTFSYTDTAKDSALNPFVLAPLNGVNNPPPQNIGWWSGWAYYAGRLWAALDNVLYFSAGPDCTNGNGLMAWPPTYYFQLPDRIYKILPYSNGLLVFTSKDLYAIIGTSTTTFVVKLQQAGLGVSSVYCVDTKGSEIYAYTTRRQLIMISPSAGIVDVGFPIGDILTSGFSPAACYVSYYTNGEDDALFICDGSANIYRLNPHQYPEGNLCWSPVSQPTNGCKFLYAGYDSSNNPMLISLNSAGAYVKRDQTVATDNGSPFFQNATIGPVTLSMPGEVAHVESISLESSSGNRATLAFLINEISGSFQAIPSYVSDPPTLPAFSSFHSDLYYLEQVSQTLARQIQVQVAYSNDSAIHEVYGYSIYGSLTK